MFMCVSRGFIQAHRFIILIDLHYYLGYKIKVQREFIGVLFPCGVIED